MFCVFLLTTMPPKESVLDFKVLVYKKYLEVLFGKSGTQIQIYPQAYIEPKYGAFYWRTKSVPMDYFYWSNWAEE